MWEYHGQQRPPFADRTGPGQESVWDYPRPPRVDAHARHIIVRANDRVIADTREALRVCETASPPTFYLPAQDVQRAELRELTARSHCEWKGEARYYALAGDHDATPVAWDYPLPSPAFAALANHLAFYPGRVACFIDGEAVRAQPGRFYAGWVTDEIVGPFKGESGTGHW